MISVIRIQPHWQMKFQVATSETVNWYVVYNESSHINTLPIFFILNYFLPKKYLLSTLPFLQNLLLIKCNPIVIEPTNKMTFGKFKQDKLSDIGRVQAL